MKLYNELAEYYYEIEKVGRNFSEEIEFLQNIFSNHKINKVIDLGCGTGEHVQALQEKGFDITGVDNSETMLEFAKKRYPNSKFVQADLQKFKGDSQVDAAICLFGTFNYLIKNEDVLESIINIKSNLLPNGILILEIWNSNPVQRIKKKPIAPVSLSKVGNLMIKRNRGFRVTDTPDGFSNLVEVNFIYNLNQETIKDRHIMRVYSLEEIRSLLEDNGLEILNTYCSYKMDKFQDNAGRMVIVCKRCK